VIGMSRIFNEMLSRTYKITVFENGKFCWKTKLIRKNPTLTDKVMTILAILVLAVLVFVKIRAI
jgi:hypothetical protein